MQVPPHAHYKQYNPNVSFTENLPPPPVITTAAHPPQTISGNPNYTQQQQLYIQQQQQLYAQQYQTLRRKQAQAQAQAQAQVQGQMNQMPQQQQQQIYQPNPNQQDKNQLPPPPQVTQQMTMSQAQQQLAPVQHQQYVTSTGMNYTPATMAVVTANNAVYVQSSQAPPIQQHTNMDTNMMYDRDKQIYKCSTLGRHGGKFDAHRQQNLVPAVIPTVPQIPKYNNNQVQVTSGAPTIPTQQMTTNTQITNNANLRPSIQNCPLPDIPSVGTFKGNNDDIGIGTNNDLPHNRCVKYTH